MGPQVNQAAVASSVYEAEPAQADGKTGQLSANGDTGSGRLCDTLTGVIKKIIFSNQENGYAVFILGVSAASEGAEDRVGGKVTVCGVNIAEEGETVVCDGTWKTHEKFGEQFIASQIMPLLPVTPEGIAAYLIDNVRGVGEKTAARIVGKFGVHTLKVLDDDITRLREVDGIGEKLLERIRDGWGEQSALRALMVFLQSHGVSARMAFKIYRVYGGRAMKVIEDNPWRMARDVPGIGFGIADTIAMRLGKDRESRERLRAGLSYVLYDASGSGGHAGLPVPAFIKKSVEILGVSRELIESAFKDEVREQAPGFIYEPETDMAWVPYLHPMETEIAAKLISMANSPPSWEKIDSVEAIQWVESATKAQLADHQKEALAMQLESKLMVVTGGPGCGKTFLLKSILHVLQRAGVTFALAAPTGKAAMRMTEATGYEASTLHRLMKLGTPSDAPQPITQQLLVVDEFSMVDIPLFRKTISALQSYGALLLVGDADQLPSVGPGSVLKDIISSQKVPVVQLTKVFRQAEGSYIIRNAHRVNKGMMIEPGPVGGDFFYLLEEDPEKVPQTVEDLVATRLPKRYGVDPLRDIQVLTPMNRGDCGTIALNQRLQARLNPEPLAYHKHMNQIYGMGDRVMQTENNYDKGVFNGDSGVIVNMDTESGQATIRFQVGAIKYDYRELDQLALAYAITIHKSQGADFPVIVVPLIKGHYMMLQRNLIYTAITRARGLCVLVGQSKALEMAIQNDNSMRRNTRLRSLLEKA